ncbi:hypothetical protein A2334_01520 [Candidatus Roizmanbacteria bacterium RIFOXYB2_FULL_38_10]|uniref:histidine kinase n=1 Tax=Candidatus Roizmanbacteria bacterium RIFOXYD1_FULL_38_12 TaxID=1802093 RepID=A0A1F7L285_9BACT|nr:MAG: hypothetical protein A3K47_05540 [Candidatus Roizmanbacteria bacterium RIFOXYA2_FULL_38_14]OGK64206.1 MAG: hypothetical protein A3K27_05540 [Candidatus Roizmanbacteria bacterium RIFOXYA1_FULL_37_12]OGK66052.1 MAG: hypothetical protein A3K38_05540 [Candidatus Roizmanbacteria bacterium RIFOXYB1_FULL_40_23]OGK68529.1 MAG: hypothetical protein A2334_01520 [Candidatus Roizmanbacteria bacterium RIFOXYB2_FULL_38_10]OGK70457.1 MAG: hypothetical protein A3K21_05545 [Candidatus Roizmanbacteria ba
MHIFTSARRKIAFYILFLGGTLIVVMTLLTILLINIEATNQARLKLEKAIRNVISDYQSENLKEVNMQYQGRAKSMTNIFKDKKEFLSDKTTKEQVVKEKEADMSPDNGLMVLKDNKQVYSRVILKNGDILYSSDLFEDYNLSPEQKGFMTIDIGSLCINAISSSITTGEQAGSIVQVAQYCSFSSSQQRSLFKKIILTTLVLLVFTYFLSLKVAGKLLKPLEKVTRQTRQFAENCYHELLTPITVAMTTIEATKSSKKYKSGIDSVEEDLRGVYHSLQTLNQQATLESNALQSHPTNMSQMLKELTESFRQRAQEKNISINTDGIKRDIYKNIERNSVKIIFRNLIENAINYSPYNSQIFLKLDEKSLLIQNTVEDPLSIRTTSFFQRGYRGENCGEVKGHGFGLAIVKDLCESYRWQPSVNLVGNILQTIIRFN